MARDRYVDSDDNNDITSAVRPRRIEVSSGSERRRRWSEAAKIAMVAEALAPEAVVSEVARRHDVVPSQLFGWMRRFREAATAAMTAGEPPVFATAVVEVAPAMPAPPPASAEPPAAIEISVGAATVLIRGAVDSRTLAAVLKALRVLA
jgi:transposase